MIKLKLVLLLVLIPNLIIAQQFLVYQNPYFQSIDTNYYQQHLVFNENQIKLEKYKSEMEKQAVNYTYKEFPKFKITPPIKILISPNLNFYTDVTSDKTINYSSFNGLSAIIKINNKISFDWLAGAYLSNPSDKIKALYDNSQVLPGLGISNNQADIIYGFQHYFDLAYRPDSIFTFSLARKSPKYGYGYSSLFLDDKQSPYTQFSADAQIWHLKYKVNIAWLKDKASYPTISDFERKYMVNHTLSWNISKRINFNFFEAVIWQPYDSTGFRGFDVNYLNPVIFYRPTEFAIGSPDNVLLGLGLNIRVFKQTYLYSQILLDEFILSHIKEFNGWWGNKHAIQAGFKSINFLRINNLHALGEINILRPFVYSHDSGMRSYGQQNQLLGYALGSNTAEILAQLNYTYKKWNFNSEASYKINAQDSTNTINLGNNPYISYDLRNREENHQMFQGIKNTSYNIQVQAKYLIIPRWNLSTYTKINFINNTSDYSIQKLYIISLGISSNFYLQNIHSLWSKI